jgi:hypothetical protein
MGIVASYLAIRTIKLAMPERFIDYVAAPDNHIAPNINSEAQKVKHRRPSLPSAPEAAGPPHG